MAMTARGFRAEFVAACLVASAVFCAGPSRAAEDALFVSKQITPPGEYTSGIEGPAVDASGNLYVVNFQQGGSIGTLAVGASQSRLFTLLPAGSIGNGIRFDRQGRMYVADFKKHNVWVIERGETTPRVYFHSAVQPAKRPRDRGGRHALCQRSPICSTRGRPDLAHYPRRRRQWPR
jgi:signal peptidase